MEHTNGPWEAHGNGIHQGTICIAITHVSPKEQAAIDAKRIVACVNACAGLDQFALDGGWTATGMSAYAKKIEQQRDELLAALESLERTSGQGCMSDDPCRIKARKAITNAKGA